MVTTAFLKTLDILPSVEERKLLEQASEWIVAALRIALLNHQIQAEVVLGGSYAKGTLIRSSQYDIDIFVRCEQCDVATLRRLDDSLKELCTAHHLSCTLIHGSRDYFQVKYRENIVLEIIPVAEIAHPREAENVADLSTDHVACVRKALRKNKALAREIGLAKQFCKAQGVYGAESYIQGFSGYALECLLMEYGSFVRMLRALAKLKEKLLLDPAKHYRKTREILTSMNASKLQSPIVLIDPTWKERNVLAALSAETFAKFQKAAQAFLRRPSKEAFVIRPFDLSLMIAQAKKQKAELLQVMLETKKQAGDIAGTKLKKFSEFLGRTLEERFTLVRKEFVYSGSHEALVYYLMRARKAELRKGPTLKMQKYAQQFRKEHPKAIVKNGRLYALMPAETSGKAFLERFLEKYAHMVLSMDVSWTKVV